MRENFQKMYFSLACQESAKETMISELKKEIECARKILNQDQRVIDEKSESCLISEINTDAINIISTERDNLLLEK